MRGTLPVFSAEAIFAKEILGGIAYAAFRMQTHVVYGSATVPDKVAM